MVTKVTHEKAGNFNEYLYYNYAKIYIHEQELEDKIKQPTYEIFTYIYIHINMKMIMDSLLKFFLHNTVFQKLYLKFNIFIHN